MFCLEKLAARNKSDSETGTTALLTLMSTSWGLLNTPGEFYIPVDRRAALNATVPRKNPQ